MGYGLVTKASWVVNNLITQNIQLWKHVFVSIIQRCLSLYTNHLTSPDKYWAVSVQTSTINHENPWEINIGYKIFTPLTW